MCGKYCFITQGSQAFQLQWRHAPTKKKFKRDFLYFPVVSRILLGQTEVFSASRGSSFQRPKRIDKAMYEQLTILDEVLSFLEIFLFDWLQFLNLNYALYSKGRNGWSC